MLEKRIEKRLTEEARRRGGMAVKFTSPGASGVPDRLVVMPGGKMGLVEVKAPGKTPRPIQQAMRRRFERLGVAVYVLDDLDGVGGAIDAICAS